MISPPLTRAELAIQFALKGKELTAKIKALKQAGNIIQRRIPVGPMTHRKRVVYNMVATTMQLPTI